VALSLKGDIMNRLIKSCVALVALASLAACATGLNLSPRERVVDLVARYAILQEVAIEAVRSPSVDADTKRAIRAADVVAVASIERLAEVSRGCARDSEGRIVLEEADQCQPDRIKVIFPVALAAIGSLQTALAQEE
jgi:hypothetical protein